MKGFFLLAAMLGLTVIGTASTTAATSRAPSTQTEFGGCKYYCGSTGYIKLAQCAAVCGGAANCEAIC